MNSKQWIAFITLSIAMGSSFLWIKIAVQEVGPFTVVGARVLIGAIALSLVVLFRFRTWKPAPGHIRTLLVVGVTNIAVPFALISWAELRIDSSVASIINGTLPLFTALIANYWLPEDRLTRMRVLGLLIGFAGILVILSRGGITGFRHNFWAQGAMLLATLSYGFSSVFIRKNTGGIPVAVQAAASHVVATGLIWAGVYLTEWPLNLPKVPITWIALLWLGLMGSFLGFLLYFYLLSTAGPTRSVMVTYAFPIVGVSLGVVFLNETLDLQLVIGALLIIVSLLLVNRRN